MSQPERDVPQINASKQLLVEGRTPQIFFVEWIKALGLTGQIEVRDFGSISQLRAFLKLFTTQQGFRERVTTLPLSEMPKRTLPPPRSNQSAPA